jgi:hypothetical protein
MQRNSLFIVLALTLGSALYSCKKSSDASTENGIFYGKWKTSYGDTIQFARENGKDILTYDNTMNPSLPNLSKSEYRYRSGKLATRWFPSADDFQVIQSFAWIVEGESFTIQGIQWFMFLSSTLTYFTFTKI